MALIKDYFEKTKRYMEEYGENTIVLMQVGAFFEVYGLTDSDGQIDSGTSQITKFSIICDLNVVDKRVCCGPNPVVMAGFKDHLLDKYVKKIQDAGFTVVVFEQDEQCANTTRSLTGIYSPGTYFSSDPETITNNVCCVWIETKKPPTRSRFFAKGATDKPYIYVGAGIVDIFTGTSSIMEFKEIYIKNPTTFDELERFMSVHNPLETIIVTNVPKCELEDIISYANIQSKTVHIVDLNLDPKAYRNVARAANCEKQKYQSELLMQFYTAASTDIVSFMNIFVDNVYATQAICYLLDFVYQHNPNLVYKIAEPTLENTNKRLILANHSLEQLNIINTNDSSYRGPYSSVLKMLNQCVTPMGRRRFSQNFLNPTTDEYYLQTEYNILKVL